MPTITDWITSLFTVALAIFAMFTYLINKKLTKFETEGEIIVQLSQRNERDPSVISLLVKNVGKGTARNIKIIEREPKPYKRHPSDTEQVYVSDIGFVRHGIKLLAPGEERVSFIYYGRKDEIPPSFELDVIYEPTKQKWRKSFGIKTTTKQNAILNFNEFTNVSSGRTETDYVEKINNNLSALNNILRGNVFLDKKWSEFIEDTSFGNDFRQRLVSKIKEWIDK